MANPFNKAKITVAAPRNKNLFSFNPQHLTTSDFFLLDVAYARELAPKSDIHVSLDSHARLAAMTLPSYINVELNQRAFFVPFRLIMKGWNDFITDSVHTTADDTYGLVTNATSVKNSALVTCLTNSLFSTKKFEWADGATPPTDAQLETADFITYSGSSAPFVNRAYQFKALGRQFYKVLRSLGYQVLWDDTLNGVAYNTTYSALPLLAYAKVFVDWYFPSQYSESSLKQDVEKILNRDNSLSPTLSSADLLLIGSLCTRVSYESDYFTSAFDKPVGPNTGNFTPSSIVDVSSNRTAANTQYGAKAAVNLTDSSSYAPSNGTPWVGVAATSASGYTGQITQYVIDALKRLTDYAKRHQLAGSVAFERFLSRFGIALPDTHRSTLISSNTVPLEVSDVMSTAQTEQTDYAQDPVGAGLGEYAGKGWIEQRKFFDFTYNNDGDFGMLLILTSIVPKIGYYQGIRRRCFHVNKLDFMTPEFDSLGNRAIKSVELLVPRDGRVLNTWTQGNVDDDIFGFTPQYSEYKCDYSNLTGDFVLNSLNKSGFTSAAWHHFRHFDDDYFEANSATHSLSFVQTEDGQQYDRIFQYAPDYRILGIRADHFVINHLFNIDLRAPYRSLYDTYDFADEDENNKVEVSTNGVMIN